MRTMAVAGWVCSLATLLSLAFAVAHSHCGEIETYYVSTGHLFLLRCLIAGAHTNVTWSRAGGHDVSLPTGVEVRDGLLYFLPVRTSHNGTYTCEKRDNTGKLKMSFKVLVSNGECPDPPETVSIYKGVRGGLPCKQTEILRLNSTRSIRWMKDCRPLEPISVDENGFMRLPAASETDAGKYTCLVDISWNGRQYTAARSIQLTINSDEPGVVPEPELLFPQGDVVMVEVGGRAELTCLAYIGFSEDNDTLMYWIINGTYAEDHKELQQSWKYVHDKGRVYGLSTLSISKVLRQFLNVSIICYVINAVGAKDGLVLLQEADHSVLHITVALCIAASLALQALAAAFLFFKVDVVLAYRKLLRHFTKQVPDGKLYDGYVSFLHPNILSSAEVASFALQILPEELENKHGYSLYIRGRDDCPGEAVHDVIAATLRQCRRLIIILSSETKPCTDGKSTEETSPLCNAQNQLCYEQKIGIHDALTQNDPQVILVEIDGPVDYSRLPESLHYIKKKQGALKWKKASLGTHKPTKLCSNRNFWKNLRYHMPSVPAGRLQTVV
ncbi:interleukin-1 receptor type 1 [Toxotes jaculatrix]|uniref:interleukin-1 receptor type 1 n=1 Tax=Toxotes jaculatrix TaxID=941984 RepID=UPI001B3AAC4A|nr:interleukin-1 receptor type 1 [Toxotes jaculatrix]XP_040913977.1 interleukin-1 receptor type 1 [Toxotes jaculatrix]